MSAVAPAGGRTPAGPHVIAVVSAGLSEPSSTRLLADRLGEATVHSLGERGVVAEVRTVELRAVAQELTTMLLTGVASANLRAALDTVTRADGLVAVSPIFSGSYNGLFKTFFDLVDDGALEGVPVLLGATAGTAVFAATDDFGHSSGVRSDDDVAPLAERVARGAHELADLVAVRSRTAPTDPFALSESFEDLLRGQ